MVIERRNSIYDIDGSYVEAVNSFCVTSPSYTNGHNNQKAAIDEAHDELNDFYTEGEHQKANTGRTKANTLMTIQKYQPQNYIFCGHGCVDSNSKEGGRTISSGIGNNGEYLSAQAIMQITKNAHKSGLEYSKAPLSVILYMACSSADDQSNKDNFCDAFMTNMSAWMYIGMKSSLDLGDAKRFIFDYSDKITDGKRSYKRAMEESVDFTFSFFELNYWYKIGGDLDHNARDDKYRSIDRVEDHEGETIENGGYKYMTYNRNFEGTTNGGYFVFHGVLDNDPEDDEIKADITISIYRGTESADVLVSTDTYYGLMNNNYPGCTIYGGSDICTRMIPASTMNTVSTSYLKIIVKFERGTAESIYIDRFELMEVGK